MEITKITKIVIITKTAETRDAVTQRFPPGVDDAFDFGPGFIVAVFLPAYKNIN